MLFFFKSVALFTYSIVQSPSWEANWFAASQEIPRISRKPKAHYCTHKRPPPVSILGQSNPVHISTSHLLEIHPNIIHPSMPRSPQWSLSLRFPQHESIHPPLLTHKRHMPSSIRVLIILVSFLQKESVLLSKFLAIEICFCIFEIATKIYKTNLSQDIIKSLIITQVTTVHLRVIKYHKIIVLLI